MELKRVRQLYGNSTNGTQNAGALLRSLGNGAIPDPIPPMTSLLPDGNGNYLTSPRQASAVNEHRSGRKPSPERIQS